MTDRGLVAVLALLAVTAGCKQRGTFELTVAAEAECRAADLAAVYLLRDATCRCHCQDCADACGPDNCVLGCADGLCTREELQAGLAIDPSAPGLYAVVLQLAALDDGGTRRLVASGCVEVQIDADGTAGGAVALPVTCCTGSDGGAGP